MKALNDTDKASMVDDFSENRVESDALLSRYWEAMPKWAKNQFLNDALTNRVIRQCAQRGDSPISMAWELARVLSGDREGIRNKLMDITERGGLGFISDNV
jgi:hypothetical protein